MADNEGKWLMVAEAAPVLGISPRSVRRWAAEGTLQVDRTKRPYLVLVTGQRLAEAGQLMATSDMTAAVATASALLRTELEGLRAENVRLRERLQVAVEERIYLRALSATLARGQQLMLEADRPRRRWRWPWQKDRGT